MYTIDCSYFDNVKGKNHKPFDLLNLSKFIKSNELKEITQNKRKEDLPIIKPSALMNGGLSSKDVIKHSSVLYLDIDIKDNMHLNFDKKRSTPALNETVFKKLKENTLRYDIYNDPYTFLAYKTFSGGLRIFVITDCYDITKHSIYWNNLAFYYSNRYNLNLDTHCKNIVSNTFLCYDQNVYCNDLSSLFTKIDPNIIYSNEEKKYQQLLVKVDTFYTDPNTSISNLNHSYSIDNVNLSDNDQNIEDQKKVSTVTSLKEKILCSVDTFLTQTLRYRRYIAENLFPDPVNTPIFIPNGLDTCDIVLYNGLEIKEGKRNSTLRSICIKLIYNNPNVEFDILLKEMLMINTKHCTPEPLEDIEVRNIVRYFYNKHKESKLYFTKYIKRKYVFYSTKYIGKITDEQEQELIKLSKIDENNDRYIIDKNIKKQMLKTNKHKLSMKCLKEGKQTNYEQKIYEIIEDLQGEKITYKKIAEKMGVSEVTIKRRMTNELKQFMKNNN
jgi:hypothetical protein